MARHYTPVQLIIAVVLALALSVFLGHEAWAGEVTDPNDDEIINTVPGYGLTDYEFMEQCYAEFLGLMKGHAQEFEDVPPDIMRQVLSRAVDECAVQLEQYRTNETTYRWQIMPDSIREYVNNYDM